MCNRGWQPWLATVVGNRGWQPWLATVVGNRGWQPEMESWMYLLLQNASKEMISPKLILERQGRSRTGFGIHL